MNEPLKSDRLNAICAVLENDQEPPPNRVMEMADLITARHGGAVKGFLFYGSGLREASNPEKMLDYYVLTQSYQAIHGRGLKALASFLIPPSVHFLGGEDGRGQPMSSKYSIVSLRAFLRRVAGGALEPMIWARFAQPAVIIAEDDPLKRTLLEARARGILHFAEETAPLIRTPLPPRDFWARALAESYRTELRAESPLARARELVERYGPRYDALAAAVFGTPLGASVPPGPAAKRAQRARKQLKWALRRTLGKPVTALRVLKGAFTFDGGLDYVLHKLESHSGASLTVTDHQRRHPLLWSPILAWKLWRQGAFR